MERVQKLLARAGVASRRESEELIRQGRVTVDGVPAELGTRADPTTQRICVNGRPIRLPEAHLYVLLHKPAGTLSTRRDPEGRPTVMDLVPAEWRQRLYPVGRLDYDASGLLLLTDDGALAHALTHPRFAVRKTYHVLVAGAVGPQALSRLRHGVMLDDGPTAPAHARVLETSPGQTVLELTIREGRKREIKRMCAAVGHPVRALLRVSMGGVELGALPVGKWRRLKPAEVDRLRRSARQDAAPAAGRDD